jgi:hypothetical protein
MLEASCLVSPIRDHAFFEQRGLLGDDFLQVLRLAPELLDLIRRSRPCGVPCELASRNSFDQEQYMLSATPSRRQSSAIGVSPRRPSSTMRIFASAEYCFHVARRMSRGRTIGGIGFLSHLRSLGATMSQKSSVPQAAKFVSGALKRNNA